MADCGACNVCCRLLNIDSLSKPAHILCWNTTLHGGCKVHHEKPEVCSGFKCIWLESQDLEDTSRRGSRAMRPDQSHAMFVRDPTDPKLVWCHVDPNFRNVWREGQVADYLDEVVSKGGHVEVIVGDSQFSLPGKDVR